MAPGTEEILVSADASELDLMNSHLQNLEEVTLPESLSVRHCSTHITLLNAYPGCALDKSEQLKVLCSSLISLQTDSQHLTVGS